MSQAGALASLLARTAPARTAADLAGLPRGDYVTAKEIADATGASVETIRARALLWEIDPADPRALPYVRALGRPFKFRRADVLRWMQEAAQ